MKEKAKEMGERLMIAIRGFDENVENLIQGGSISHESFSDKEIVQLAGALHFLAYYKFVNLVKEKQSLPWLSK